MSGTSRENLLIATTVAAVSLLLVAVSCAPMQSQPRKVEETRPSVSYAYSTDEELIQARPEADAFCSQYRSIPRAARISSDSEGQKVIVFECVSALSSTVPDSPNVNRRFTSTYRTDTELMTAWQNAQDFCMRNGGRVSSNITENIDGTKTVTFQCIST